MTEKSEFYRELLRIDSSSKVFYPLAVLLFEARHLDEAAKTLRQGLTAHGDHLEARLLLVETLEQLGLNTEAAAEADKAISILSRFPAFWRIWASQAGKGSKDLALALNFLANHFKGQTLSWAELIQSAFEVLSQTQGPSGNLEKTHGNLATAAKESIRTEAEVQPQKVEEPLQAYVQQRISVGPSLADTSRRIMEQFGHPGEDASGNQRKPERRFGGSLRTRTMADLLAAQGDFDGAAEIYEELVRDVDDERQKQMLVETIARVRAEAAQKKGQAPFVSSRSMDGQVHNTSLKNVLDSSERPQANDKLIALLEKLAQGLEGRAQS
ncbi:tetratricopeptide repeat protein [Desulfocurvibacter africanus]|uniref:tetratricopeptide repeat protein n=1 Tax=Desulfocurvibacter africanus TaxID=873 RepID=UPI002FDA8E6F